jgi:hypothetical protein
MFTLGLQSLQHIELRLYVLYTVLYCAKQLATTEFSAPIALCSKRIKTVSNKEYWNLELGTLRVNRLSLKTN